MQRTKYPAENASEAAAAGLSADEIRDNNRFLDSLARALAGATPSAPVHDGPPPPPDAIPGYSLQGEIHRGGHGIVYEAIQLRTKRRVAIKILLRGATATRRQRQRLEHEAEIIASLRHPGIVTVYDGQYFDDERYAFAMEYIEGLPLDQWAGGGAPVDRSQVLARLRLFETICDAVAFAHLHGVIHRDLKPANILIDNTDQAHILDFGIAKAMQAAPESADDPDSDWRVDGGAPSLPAAAFLTLPGEFAGTLAYASPEQVSGDPAAIDTRTDVYSLGVILYQLLTGQTPYPCAGSLSEVVRHIERTVRSAPSRASRWVDADIDAIVLRSLEKDKEDRYASVSGLQTDVRRYLAGKAIEARSDSGWYVLRKSLRRHLVPASIATLCVLVLAGFAVAMTLLYTEKRHAESAVLAELRQREIMHGRSEITAGRHGLAEDLIWRAHLNPRPTVDPPQRTLLGGAIEPLDSYWALWELYAEHPRVATVDAHSDTIYSIAIAPDGSAVATGGHDGALRIWSLPELQLVDEHLLDGHVGSVSFSDDGRRVGAACRGGDKFVVFDLESGEEVASTPLPTDNIRGGVLNADWSALVSSGTDGVMHLLTLDGAPERRVIPTPGSALSAVFSRDGDLLATSTIVSESLSDAQSTVSIWSLPEMDLLAQTVQQRDVTALLFTPDGEVLLWATNLAEIESWDYDRAGEPEVLTHATSRIVRMAWFDHDDGTVVARDWDKSIRLIDLRGEKPAQEVANSARDFQLLHKENQPAKVFSGLADGRLTVWEAPTEPYRFISRGDHLGCHAVAISPDNRTLAYAGGTENGPGVILTPLDGDREQIELSGHTERVSAIAFSPDGRFIASSSFDGTAMLWDAVDGSPLERFTDHTGRLSTVAFGPDSNTVAFAGDGDVVYVRDLDAGSVLALETDIDADPALGPARIPSVAFHPDGRRLATAGTDGVVRLWDITTGAVVEEFMPSGGAIVRAVCFSPHGEILASGTDDDAIVLTRLSTGSHEVLQAHPTDVFALAFGPEGRVLISGDRFGGVMLWDVRESRQVATLPGHPELMMSIAVSPDGMRMATGSAGLSPEVRLWDLAAYRPHVAGNLEHHARLVTESLGHEPANLGAMQEWAADVTRMK